jgi:negative regulator of sigma E activity
MPFCANCGMKIDEQAYFCSECGASLANKSKVDAHPQTPQNEQTNIMPILSEDKGWREGLQKRPWLPLAIVALVLVVALVGTLVYNSAFSNSPNPPSANSSTVNNSTPDDSSSVTPDNSATDNSSSDSSSDTTPVTTPVAPQDPMTPYYPYLNTVGGMVQNENQYETNIEADLNEISSTNEACENDPQWRANIVANLAGVGKEYTAIQGVSAPVPFADSNAELVQTFYQYSAAGTLMADAIDNNNVQEMASALHSIQQGVSDMSLASDELAEDKTNIQDSNTDN